jgi:hypothetical protein
MDYQTLIGWAAANPETIVAGVVVLAVIGAIRGIRRSLDHCRFTGRRGRKVL